METIRSCGTCNFWQSPNGNGEGKFGTCLLITANLSGFKPAPNAAIEVDAGLNEGIPYAKLRTTKDFGCTEWEPF
jgi:hypothetical protein